MMLQFAFGPGSTGVGPSDGMASEIPVHMQALAAAARAWWESSRPEGWSLEQHLAAPTAGCDGSEAERALAEAVGQWMRTGT